MSELLEKKPQPAGADQKINRIMLYGFLIRAVVLILILALASGQEDLYFLSDDMAYEEDAKEYLQFARSVVDVKYLDTMLEGYMQPFWSIVMCVLAKLFKSIYAGRALNIVLSTLCIRLIYKLTKLLSQNENAALWAGGLFAFLPLTILTCCFPIKDIFLTWAVLYVFYVFVRLHMGQSVPIWSYIFCAACLAGIYYARGAVMELLLVFLAVILLHRFIKQKNYYATGAVALLLLVAALLYGDNVIEALETKLDDYSEYNSMSTGLLAGLQMRGAGEFYKLPLAYVFATFQPMLLNLFAEGQGSDWLLVMSYLNITMYPVAVANVLYFAHRKHNLLFWLFGFALYCAIISVSLGIFRHYLFLLPLQIINCALYFDEPTAGKKWAVLFGSLGLLLLIAVYSLLRA